jgi:DNA-directed RNA polymerase specialized sigma24 family protein
VVSHSVGFPTTHWSLIIVAGDRAVPEARAALAELCKTYWYPVYALIRRRNHPPDEASDLTQDYFIRLLEKGVIAAADRSKGRFRNFLKTDCQHFLLDRYRRTSVRAQVEKMVSIDVGDAEGRYRFEPAHVLTPDRLFDRAWAMTLLERVLGLLAEEYAAKDRAEVFDLLKIVLTQGKGTVPAAELAVDLGTTEGAIYKSMHKLRKRYRTLLEQEIAATLDDPSDLDEEVRWLFEVMSS